MKKIILLVLLFSFTSVNAREIFQAHVSYVPAGTPVSVRLNQTLSSEFTQVGETFTAALAGPIYAGSNLVAPPGSQVQGQIVAVESAGRTGKPGYMDMRLVSIITPDGRRIPLSASVERSSFKLEAEGGRGSHFVKHTAVGAGSGALAGLIGASISGGKKGKAAAIGTGIGAGTGILAGAFRKGREFVLRSGTTMPFRLDQAIQANAGATQVQQRSPVGDFADPGLAGYGSSYSPPAPAYQSPPPAQAHPYSLPPQNNPYMPSPSYHPPVHQPYQAPPPAANPYLYDQR